MGFPRRPHESAGDGVGINLNPLDVDVGYLVRSARMGGATQIDPRRGLEAPVGATVENHPCLVGHDGPVPHDPGLELDDGAVPGVACGEFFDVVHHHFDRAAAVDGQVVGQGDIHGRALAAEVAADANRIEEDPLFGKAQGIRHLLFHRVWYFAGRPDLDPSLLVDPDQAGMGLQVGLVLWGHGEGVLHYEIGLGKTLFHVSFAPSVANEGVGRRFQKPGQTYVAVYLGMQDGRVRLQGFQRIVHGGQFLVLHLNLEQRLFGGVPVNGCHRGHSLPNEADPVLGQDRHIVKPSPVPYAM